MFACPAPRRTLKGKLKENPKGDLKGNLKDKPQGE
jgi:hypothetical protein